jgi:chromosome segregation ATPase
MDAKKGLLILVILLLLGLIGLGYWGYSKNKAAKELTSQNALLNGQVGDLSGLRDGLQRQVDSLEQAYNSLAEENQNLQGSVTEAEKTIASQSATINKIKKQGASESSNLKTQIEQLLKAKAVLEGNIQDLQAENDSLRTLTGQLTTDLASAKSENDALASLNKTMNDEMKKLTLANFKASAFRVEVERKKPKATAKAGRARRILVSFDLTDVKQEFRGLRPLYLVITDDKGTPIKNSNPIQAKVNVNGQQMDILAVQKKDTDIVQNQRLTFTHDLEDKLKSGFYRVAVYTDIGLLGAASFRLQ